MRRKGRETSSNIEVRRASLRGTSWRGVPLRTEWSALSALFDVQAGCQPGIWTRSGQKRIDILEYRGIDAALNSAAQSGADALPQGLPVPDCVADGPREQRRCRYRTGFENRIPNPCGAFGADPL